jgi:hypothetical protein
MDNQEAFSRVVDHLRQQGRPSHDSGNCAYRSKDGLRCAVGVLITDEFYKPELEGYCAEDMADVLCVALPGVSIGLLQALQDTHDLPEDTDTPEVIMAIWEARWKDIAEHWNLTVPERSVSCARNALACS